MPGSSVTGQKKNHFFPLPRAKALLNDVISQQPKNASSPKARMVSSQNGLQRITSSGLPSTRTLPSPAFSLQSSPSANFSTPLARPFPGKESSSNIQPPLNLPRTFDKRLKTEVPLRIRKNSLDEVQKSVFPSRHQEPSVAVTWDLAPLPTSITKISAAAHPYKPYNPYKCITCCKSFKYEASL